jgi:hypothetical protein
MKKKTNLILKSEGNWGGTSPDLKLSVDKIKKFTSKITITPSSPDGLLVIVHKEEHFDTMKEATDFINKIDEAL